MDSKKNSIFKASLLSLLCMCGIIAGITALSGNMTIFFISVGIFVFASLFTALMLVKIRKDMYSFLLNMSDALSATQKESLTSFPIPIFLVKENGEIIWYNALCQERVLDGDSKYGARITDMLPKIDLSKPCPPFGYDVEYKGNHFYAFVTFSVNNSAKFGVVYLVDVTELNNFKKEYFSTRPAVAIINIDNYEDLKQGSKDADSQNIVAELEKTIEKFAAENKGLFLRTERDRFVAVFEERNLNNIIESRFSILDKARLYVTGNNLSASLSIGVGRSGSMNGGYVEAEQMARQALDMAFGRGGDQAAIKTQNGYEFYGGISKGVEKSSKVRVRIIAAALEELINNSDSVIIMGHKMPDLDALGAAIGLNRIIRLMGKQVVIAVNRQANLAQQLIGMSEQAENPPIFVDPAELLQSVTKKTLLIIVDTHIKHFVEFQKLYEACEKVAVIDHHRKSVDHIDNAMLFFHEPHASSASEMVAELIQYFGGQYRLSHIEANALLAGIMLDTKNFVLRTGVRTFEAAAYLRKSGADTVEVKKLFASSKVEYNEKAKLVSAAEIYRRCAISACPEKLENASLVAPQAADELLTIDNVDASFVIFEYGVCEVGVSARSLGLINVQIIMEELGGGGHHTMAGTQIQSITLEYCRSLLIEAIDKYYKNMEQANAAVSLEQDPA